MYLQAVEVKWCKCVDNAYLLWSREENIVYEPTRLI